MTFSLKKTNFTGTELCSVPIRANTFVNKSVCSFLYNLGMICQLCKEEKPLLKNSHIIPNFLYRGLFDEKHKIINVNLNNLKDKEVHQTGFKDRDILCATCDNGILGKLERYASNTIFGNNDSIEIEFHQGNKEIVSFVRYKNLDYTQIKLFFLSILWKSHISKHRFFNEIELGVKYSEQLRQMIYHNDAGAEDAFEVLLIRPVVNGNRPTKSPWQTSLSLRSWL